MSDMVPRSPGKTGGRRNQNGKMWFPTGRYSMQGDDELIALAQLRPRKGEKGIPVFVRIMFAAMGRGNIWGHAAFAPGELARLIGLGNNSRTIVKGGVQDLVKVGLAAPESTPRCVVLSAALYRRGDYSEVECQEPGHQDRSRRLWVSHLDPAMGDGWEPNEGDYQGILNRGEGSRLAASRRRKVTEEEIETTTTTRTRRRVVEEEETVIPMPRMVSVPAGRMIPTQPQCCKPGCNEPLEGSVFCHKHRVEAARKAGFS